MIQGARRGYVTAGRTRLSYLELGAGPPLVLLHGFPQSPLCWRLVAPALARTHRVLAFDLKGYGESDKPRSGYDLATLSWEIREALRALGIDRARWVGHDWGGVLVWAIALRFPEVVERFAILNAPLDRINPLASWYVLPFSVPGLMERVFARYGNVLERLFRHCAYSSSELPAEIVREYVRLLQQPDAARAALSWYRALPTSAAQLARWLPREIARPCLIVWAIHDPALPVTLLEGIERHLRGPFEIHPVARSGHWVMEERPELVSRLLGEFFDVSHRPA